MNAVGIQLASETLTKCFMDDLERGMAELVDLIDIPVIVGVPFHNEDDTLPAVVEVARKGLANAGLDGAAVVCVGSHIGGGALRKAVNGHGNGDVAVRGFLLGRGLEGRGWAVRALMEVASLRKAHLIILQPDLFAQEDGRDEAGAGFAPHWIERLLDPVMSQDQDLALARFNRHPLAHAVESLFVYPMLRSFFRTGIRQPVPGVFAMSPNLIKRCLYATTRWSLETGTYGFDAWLVVRAIIEGAAICEVPLGAASYRHGVGKLKLIFKQTAQVILEQTVEQERWWTQGATPISFPRMIGRDLDAPALEYEMDKEQMLLRFKAEFNHFDQTMFEEMINDNDHGRLERLALGEVMGHKDAAREWSRVVEQFVIAYRFDRGFHPSDVVDGLYPMFLARLICYMEEINELSKVVPDTGMRESIVRHEADRLIAREAERFLGPWPRIVAAWKKWEGEAGAYLPRISCWEFVPHVGVAVPQEIRRADGSSAWAHEVYQSLIDSYRSEFSSFVADHLHLEETTGSDAVLTGTASFMQDLDRLIGARWLEGDLSRLDVTEECAARVTSVFSTGTSFQLTEDAIRHLFERNPPRNLMNNMDLASVSELLERVNPNDALGMAALTDRQKYLTHVLDCIEREAEPDWFHVAPLKPVVVDLDTLPNTDDVRATAALARLAGRVVVGTHVRGWGGNLSKLWFMLQVAKRVIGLEMFAQVWQDLAADEKGFGPKLAATIRGHWGRKVLSAHNSFENAQQRLLVDRMNHLAADFEERDPDRGDLARALKAAATVYHLSITLPDATFIPLSAWTWASYSARGGTGAPTPLSSLVERDWAGRDFLTGYLELAGLGGAQTIDRTVRKLMMEGREFDDLGERLLGVATDMEHLFVKQAPLAASVRAGGLVRPVKGPILEPIAEHSWESRYVLNAAAVRLDGIIYILYRAYGDDEISRIGLAWTRDGVHIDGRLDEPIFAPGPDTESAGCEDPRVTVIDERVYMLYTAWDRTLPQIALASISVQAFIERRWDTWQRHGLGFPGLSNKDATLYPRKFDGRYALYHRLDPNMWISYLDTLDCPWPRTGHRIVVGPRPGMMWDGLKIGAGAQPIETTHGWLNIYHGVDYERSYRLGVLFTDLEDPSKVIYQSPNPILEPEVDFEIGGVDGGEDFWVPRVVFTCGAVPVVDKPVMELDDEIFVYYGAADTAIGVAKGRLSDLVPVLKENKKT